MFILQTIWIGITGGFAWQISRMIADGYWLSIPLFLVMWIVAAWVGITIISLFNSDHRVCAKLGIKIENLPYYKAAYQQMKDAEKLGVESPILQSDMPDIGEWLRYYTYREEKQQ